MQTLTVTVEGVAERGRIPGEYAFGVPGKDGPFAFGPNVSPALRWSGAPNAAKSFAVVMYDASVPTVFDDANKEGKTIPASMKRMDFHHWILVDIPAGTTQIARGAESNGVTARGKPYGRVAIGLRGINDFGGFFASMPDMAGDYGGYDGPAPPWNDEALHEYHFVVFALDVASLGLSGRFFGKDVMKAMEGHVLAKGEAVGLYTLNPKLR